MSLWDKLMGQGRRGHFLKISSHKVADMRKVSHTFIFTMGEGQVKLSGDWRANVVKALRTAADMIEEGPQNNQGRLFLGPDYHRQYASWSIDDPNGL